MHLFTSGFKTNQEPEMKKKESSSQEMHLKKYSKEKFAGFSLIFWQMKMTIIKLS